MDQLIVQEIQVTAVQWAQQIVGALLVLVIGWRITGWIGKRLEAVLEKSEVDLSLRSFLKSLLGFGLKGILFVMILGIFGVETTSIIALLGAMGFAIGMALQGSLGNLAGGVLILLLKPFRVGDFIEGAGFMGTVKDITVFNTQLTLPDNRVATVPNGMLANTGVINYSMNDTRRVDMVFGVSYDADIEHVKQVIKGVSDKHDKVLDVPEPLIRLATHADSALNFNVRVWVNSADYWSVYYDMMEEVKNALDQAGIEIPYPHAVHIMQKSE